MKLASLGLAAVLMMPASLAEAQPQPRGWPQVERPAASPRHARPRREAVPPGPVCIPWCQWDQNPCDPPAFKIADGRCFQEG